MPTTKSFQVFADRISLMKQTFQMADLALTMAQKHCMKEAGKGKKIAETMGGSLSTHLQLNIPDNKLDIQRTFITSRNRQNQQALVELFRAFSYYIKSVVMEMAHQDPIKLQGILSNKADRTLTYPDIINLGSYNAIITDMANKVFRTLENMRNTTEMLDKLITLTSANINKATKDDALVYLELRHLIIHNNSQPDEKFIAKNTKGLVKINPTNNKISYNYDLSNKAMNVVYQLCRSLDSELVRLGFVKLV